MGDTRAACIERWWIAKEQGNLWRSFCVQEMIKWWGHQGSWWTLRTHEDIQILRGRCSSGSLRPITEPIWKPSKLSRLGFNNNNKNNNKNNKNSNLIFNFNNTFPRLRKIVSIFFLFLSIERQRKSCCFFVFFLFFSFFSFFLIFILLLLLL